MFLIKSNGDLKILNQTQKIRHFTRQTHTHALWHSYLKGPAKSVLILVHLAAGDQGASVDCFLAQLVLGYLQLQEIPSLQQRLILAWVDCITSLFDATTVGILYIVCVYIRATPQLSQVHFNIFVTWRTCQL